jgi:alpha-glucosidase (family GH31 glycosyl hydrolase)/AraC-like DNA-binding protein
MEETNVCIEFELETGGYLRVDAVASGVFRIRLGKSGVFKESPFIRYGILSDPLAKNASNTVTVDKKNIKSLENGVAVLSVDQRDGCLLLRDVDGRERTRSGALSLNENTGFDIQFALKDEEFLYGLGDVSRERVQHRGYKAHMRIANVVSYAPIPYVMSNRGWALLMNTTQEHTFDLGCTVRDRLRVIGPERELDFYLFVGDGFGDLLNRYTDIVGKPTLLPIWAYGLTFIAQEGLSARDVVDDALRLRSAGIPCDAIGLDGGWMERRYDHSIRKAWHPERFYIPKSSSKGPHTFIGTLNSHGFKLSLLLYCDYDLSKWEESRITGTPHEQEHFESWYEHLKPFVAQGVSSFKLIPSRQLQKHPLRIWANGMTDVDMHNLYPVLYAKQMYEGYSEQTDMRPMLYTIAGYTGIQQYAGTWAGSSHNGIEALVSMLNHGMSGHANTTSDMYIHTREGIHFGFLQPWSQINSWAYFRHPAFLEEELRELFKTYARLRYRLLPYLYTAAHEAVQTGMPILRAMPLHFPLDPACRDMLHQYMLGPSMLVAVYTECVYLPEGRWIDYWTGEAFEGPRQLEYRLPEGAGGPLFVRAGAIIPMWPDVQYTGGMPAERIWLHLYPHGASTFAMAEDDGVSFRYKEGEVAITRFHCEAVEGGVQVRIEPRSGRYEGMPASRGYEVVMHGQAKPAKLLLNGQRLPELNKRDKTNTSAGNGWYFDRLNAIACVRIEAAEESELCVEAMFRLEAPESEPDIGDSPSVVRKERGKAVPEAEKQLEIALLAGRHAEALSALSQWWSNGMRLARTDDEWRMRLLEGCLLLTRQATQNGWPTAEVFGDDYSAMFQLQAVASRERGLRLLETFAGHLLRYVHRKSDSAGHPLVQEMVRIVDSELDRPLSLNDIASRLHVHPSHLSRLFKRETGRPFSEYVWKRKMERGKALLESGMKVYEAAAKTGFKDVSYFSRVFRKYWGVPPVELRR